MRRLKVVIIGLGLLVLVSCGGSTPEPTVTSEQVGATTISTELSQCVTLVAFLASYHVHGGASTWGDFLTSSSTLGSNLTLPSPKNLFDVYCGSYIDLQLLEKFKARDWDVPEQPTLTREEARATQSAGSR